MLLLRPNPTYSDALISIATHATRNSFNSPAMWMNRPHRGNRKQEKETAVLFFFSPPCVDLNDLTAITPKQKLEDESCSCVRAHRLTLWFPERTFRSPRRATSVSLRTRCVWICCRQRQIVVAFYVIKKYLSAGALRTLYAPSLLIWP